MYIFLNMTFLHDLIGHSTSFLWYQFFWDWITTFEDMRNKSCKFLIIFFVFYNIFCFISQNKPDRQRYLLLLRVTSGVPKLAWQFYKVNWYHFRGTGIMHLSIASPDPGDPGHGGDRTRTYKKRCPAMPGRVAGTYKMWPGGPGRVAGA